MPHVVWCWSSYNSAGVSFEPFPCNMLGHCVSADSLPTLDVRRFCLHGAERQRQPLDHWLHRCVCVCTPLIAKSFELQRSAGGQPREHSWLPNEEGYATADTGSDQPSVPASVSASAFASEVARGQAEKPHRT